MEPSNTLTSFPESPKLYLLSPYLCSHRAPQEGGKIQGTWLGHEFQPSPVWVEGREQSACSGCLEGQDWGRVDMRRRKSLAHPGKDGWATPVTSWLRGQEEDKFQKERETKIQTA